VLDDPGLATAFNTYIRGGAGSRGSGRASTCCALAQECNYLDSKVCVHRGENVVAFFPCCCKLMACAGRHDALGAQELPYGFLTTYRHTFFIKRVALKHFAVTDAYLPTSTNPSVPEMLFCESVRWAGVAGAAAGCIQGEYHAMRGGVPSLLTLATISPAAPPHLTARPHTCHALLTSQTWLGRHRWSSNVQVAQHQLLLCQSAAPLPCRQPLPTALHPGHQAGLRRLPGRAAPHRRAPQAR
jgi:hypothetical protein